MADHKATVLVTLEVEIFHDGNGPSLQSALKQISDGVISCNFTSGSRDEFYSVVPTHKVASVILADNIRKVAL